jgi:hypothetical protein
LRAVTNSHRMRLSAVMIDWRRACRESSNAKDINDSLRYVLLTESSYPYFQEYIQKLGKPELELSPDPEERGIMDAYQHASSRFKQVVGGIAGDPGLDPEKKSKAIRDRLVVYRDKILSLKTIIIELDDEDDAYVIFETLNTRGKDLEPEDLVKNHLARLLLAKSADMDPTRTRWTKVVEAITESGAKLDMSTYIHTSFLALTRCRRRCPLPATSARPSCG